MSCTHAPVSHRTPSKEAHTPAKAISTSRWCRNPFSAIPPQDSHGGRVFVGQWRSESLAFPCICHRQGLDINRCRRGNKGRTKPSPSCQDESSGEAENNADLGASDPAPSQQEAHPSGNLEGRVVRFPPFPQHEGVGLPQSKN